MVLPRIPETLASASGLLSGRWAGAVPEDPVPDGTPHGRVRRWHYVAAGDEAAVVGAAVVDLGFLAVAFAFASLDGAMAVFETKRPLGRGVTVGSTPAEGADLAARGSRMRIGGDGAFSVDVPTRLGRLRATVEVTIPSLPMTLCTPTAGGGWNVTEKAAGYGVEGEVQLADGPRRTLGVNAGGWSDWTAGRQDRHTVWRWAAGSGVASDGRRVGLNVSTGMNAAEAGEDIVWWNGSPVPLTVTELGPTSDDMAGPWQVAGPGWQLAFAPSGVRAERTRLGVLVSDYTQPVGRFAGTLPDPTGSVVGVQLAGVTEDHLAVW